MSTEQKPSKAAVEAADHLFHPFSHENKLSNIKIIQEAIYAETSSLQQEQVRRIKYLNRLGSWAQQDPTGPMNTAENNQVKEWVLAELKAALGSEYEPTEWQPSYIRLQDEFATLQRENAELEQNAAALRDVIEELIAPFQRNGLEAAWEKARQTLNSITAGKSLQQQLDKAEAALGGFVTLLKGVKFYITHLTNIDSASQAELLRRIDAALAAATEKDSTP